MAIISKRGIFGIKWSWIFLAASAYLFRKPLQKFAKPYLDKLSAKFQPKSDTQTIVDEDLKNDTTNEN